MLPKRQTEELEYPAMKPEQLEVAVPFIEGRDVFAVLPTGFRFLENQGPQQCQHTFDPPLPTSNTIIVTFINKEWIPLAQNWICSAERVGLSNALYLVAMERNVCQHFPNTPCYQHPTAAIEGTYFGQPGYQQFMIERTRFILSMLPCTKSHVLLSDTDIVFKKNPIALLDSELVNHDIVFQEDSTGIYLMDSFVTYIFSYICGGFVYLKPSNEMVNFYRSVLTYQLNWNWNDQAGLNICIRHRSRSLRWKTLDKTLFPNGKEFFHFHPDNMMALAVHANFMPRTADKTCHRACISAKAEAGSGLGHELRNTRPADILASNWLCGKPAAFDLTVVSPLNPTFISEAGRTAGSAAVAAELRKHSANDAKCSELGWTCIPLVAESYGAWGSEAVQAFSRLASYLATRTNSPKSKVVCSLYGRLNLTLVRANARALLLRC
eukprot:Em0017g811a